MSWVHEADGVVWQDSIFASVDPGRIDVQLNVDMAEYIGAYVGSYICNSCPMKIHENPNWCD